MGQTGSVSQVTRDYDEPLHLRLHFTYNPTEYYFDYSVSNTPFTAKQVATLVRTKWPPFYGVNDSWPLCLGFCGGHHRPKTSAKD